MLAPLFLIACLSGFTNGFLSLQTSTEFACIGETVIFSCATSHQSLTWEVTFTDRTIGSKMQMFRSDDSPNLLLKSVYGQQLQFQLISTDNGVIESTLVVQALPLMENATITCEGSVIRHLTFRLAYGPGIPTGIALNEIHYGSRFANVTLTWSEPAGRVDNYSIDVIIMGLSLHLSTTDSKISLDKILYNEVITVTVSAINCVAESEKINISFVISGCNSDLSSPHNGLLYNISELGSTKVASGEQVWFGCESGFYPREPMITMCQEDGLWYPDPSKVNCRRECPVPTNLSNIELTLRRDSGDNTSSLTIFFSCRDGFIPNDKQIAICSSDGTWVPDLEQFECRTTTVTAIIPSATSNYTDYHINIIYVITGSVVGSAILLVICGLLFTVMIRFKLQCHANSNDASSCTRPDPPVYECITGPVCEYLNPTSTPVMTENEAYDTCRKETSIYDIM